MLSYGNTSKSFAHMGQFANAHGLQENADTVWANGFQAFQAALDGDGDYSNARNILQRAYDLGHEPAAFWIALTHFNTDVCETVKWLNKAVQKGNSSAALLCGKFHLYNEFDGQNIAEGIRLLELAANQGESDAMIELWEWYSTAEEPNSDPEKALQWLKTAADNSNPKGMYEFALVNARGNTADNSMPLAIDLMQKSARAGFMRAMVISQLPNSIETWDLFIDLLDTVTDIRSEHHYDAERLNQENIVVCQYTTLDAIYSMLGRGHEISEEQKTNHLRMYNIGYVNDPQEGRALIKSSQKSNYLFRLADGGKGISEISKFTYFTSTSNARDRLDLWRAYGRDGKGCCLVIPNKLFRERSQDITTLPWYERHRQECREPDNESDVQDVGKTPPTVNIPMCLYSVKYTSKAKREALKTLKKPIGGILKLLKRLGSNNNDKTKIDDAVRMILAEILFLFKDAEYESEKEFRMLSMHLDSDYRLSLDEEKRDSGVRHLFVPSKNVLFNQPGYEIIIGPKVTNAYPVQREMEYLLQVNGWRQNVKVSVSEVKYR